jgi:putative transposase
MPDGRHHGRAVGEDDGARRTARLRWPQAGEGPQAAHPRRHARTALRLSVEPANTSDRVAGFRLIGGLRFACPDLRTLVADAGHESRKLARALKRHDGYDLQIVKRRQRAFRITGLTWVVERSIAWLNRNRRPAKDYEYRVQSSETMIDLAAIRLILNRLAPA